MALYVDDGHFNPMWKKVVNEGEIVQVLGCMGWGCCPAGGFYAGHWMGRDGFEPEFDGGFTACGHALATGQVVSMTIGRK